MDVVRYHDINFHLDEFVSLQSLSVFTGQEKCIVILFEDNE